MTYAFPLGELPLGSVDVTKHLEFFEQPFVLADIDNHGGAAASLREDESAAGPLDLLDQLGCASPKLGDRLDVVAKVRASHAYSLAHLWTSAQRNASGDRGG